MSQAKAGEALILDGVRTPIGRFGGALSTLRADDLAAMVLRTLLERHPALAEQAPDDVILGCANQAGEDNRNVARMAALLAGYPVETSGVTVNRLCGSGMDAIAHAGRMLRLGEASLTVAGGVESMSRAPFVMPKAERAFDRAAEIHDTTIGWRFINPRMRELYGVDSMGETAENVAEEHGISREDQDAFAARSQQRAGRAIERGIFNDEIQPVSIPRRKRDDLVVEHDEHPRPETTAESLAGLRAAFRAGGTVTAGNAAGVNDGAAALLLADERGAKRLGLDPRARIVGSATSGLAPRVMGLGPIEATRRVLDRTGLKLADMDVVELNEAFAAQALGVLRALGLPDDAEHVNPNGGAIALGHPLGMSGARLVLTAVNELHRRSGRYALCTMCIGVGQGIAMIVERI